MTWLAGVLLGAGIGIGLELYRRRQGDRVSERWMREQERTFWNTRDDIAVISWKWPVKKLLNESPLWNRYKLRGRG